MTDKQTPSDWVLIEAAKRSGMTLDVEWLCRTYHHEAWPGFRALCDMIERYEQPPVDRKVLCAREAVALASGTSSEFWRRGNGDKHGEIQHAIRAIELFEEGFGK